MLSGLQGLGLLFEGISFEVFLPSLVVGRDWRFGDRFSFSVVGPTDCDRTKKRVIKEQILF